MFVTVKFDFASLKKLKENKKGEVETMKRRLSIILLTLILIMALLVPLAGCQGKPNQQGEKTIKFVDSAGREVELPQKALKKTEN
jgi:ABC-type oligopeptide transport system substrate-binding subunit